MNQSFFLSRLQQRFVKISSDSFCFLFRIVGVIVISFWKTKKVILRSTKFASTTQASPWETKCLTWQLCFQFLSLLQAANLANQFNSVNMSYRVCCAIKRFPFCSQLQLAWHSNIGSTNTMSLGQKYLFWLTNGRPGEFWETCMITVLHLLLQYTLKWSCGPPVEKHGHIVSKSMNLLLYLCRWIQSVIKVLTENIGFLCPAAMRRILSAFITTDERVDLNIGSAQGFDNCPSIQRIEDW